LTRPNGHFSMSVMNRVPLLLLAAALPAAAQEIPYGFEAVTGYRSEYIWRGFKVGGDVMDFQLQTEVALDNHWSVNGGGWYATESGEGDANEAAGFIGVRYDDPRFSVGFDLTSRSVEHPILEDGVDLSPWFSWHVNDDLGVTFGAAWDTGPGAPYAWLETKWTKTLGDKAFITLLGGTSWLDDYYGRSGWNDLYGRISLTYNVSKRVSVTPFLGVSIPLDANPETDRLYGGVWFEVNF
jgi:hypothetical protein